MHKQVTLRRFDDMHCHFRTDEMLTLVLPFTAQYCGRAIAMPNIRPRAILNSEDVIWYRRQMYQVLDAMNPRPDFKPLMTIEIRDNTTSQIVEDAHRAGAVAGKIYPLGVTTNSDEGLRDFFSKKIIETFRVMEDLGMLLLIHGELSFFRTLVTKREEAFLPTFFTLAEMFPRLKIVLEHISTAKGIEAVKQLGENIAGTITLQHCMCTLNDVVGDGVRPHNACMPIYKDFSDRDAILSAATSGSPKFFLGSDTAPHRKENKECARGACGVFSAPILPELLVEIFEKANALDKLEDFSSRFGAEFYGLPLNEGQITLVAQEWTVSAEYGNVVPFSAGQKLQRKRI